MALQAADFSLDEEFERTEHIPSGFFSRGPITLKAYQEALKRTPAQPRRSRTWIRSPIPAGGELYEPAGSTHGYAAISLTSHPDRQDRFEIPISPPQEIYQLATGSPHSIAQSPAAEKGSAEPSKSWMQDDNQPASSQNRRHGQSDISSLNVRAHHNRNATTSKITAKKRYHAKLPPATRTLTHSPDTFDDVEPKKSSRKMIVERRVCLPIHNELVMVPPLGGNSPHDSHELIPDVQFLDPIEDVHTKMAAPSLRCNIPMLPPAPKRLKPIQKTVSFRSQKSNSVLDAFNFRTLRNSLRGASSTSYGSLIREGFDEEELTIPPKVRIKKFASRTSCFALPQLILVKSASTDQPALISMTNEQSEGIGYFNNPLPVSLHSGTVQGSHSNMTESVDNLRDTRTAAAVVGQKADRPISTLKSSRRVSLNTFNTEVQSQLLSVTAPARECDSCEVETDQSDSESNPEPDEVANGDWDEVESVYESEPLICHNRNIVDDIEDDNLLLETNGAQIAVPGALNGYETRPGNIERMKPSGRWIEVHEDILEVIGSMHDAQVTSEEDYFQVRSAAKRPREQESLSTSHGDQRDTGNFDLKRIGILPAPKTRNYFAHAGRQLSSPTHQHHVIMPRRHTQDGTPMDDDDDDDFVLLHDHQIPSPPIDLSSYFGVIRTNSCAGIEGQSDSRIPIHDLKQLVRRTSREFGTTSGRSRRTPSLPFHPPFLRNIIEH